ncbi:MFS transporter [Phenylobacterium sp.]|uniref:MFS transporter n=1 Tax=Phenylobacterium sp. TaxID=1871053 RepID=UPI002718BD37|nr:MFS transporter [Phenylobacterium sp.]MDO8800764.1 MFS transporter [Phenylobacterium sp.]
MEDVAAGIRRKLIPRLLAPVVLLHFFNALDRSNLSFAAISMNPELGIDPKAYGFGAGLFFVGYLAFQAPHVWLLTRMSARWWIFGTVLVWGTVASCMSLIHDVASFNLLRFLLGVAESGWASGIILYLSRWMPRRYRAGAFSAPMLAIPLSVVVGGPLSGWLLSMDNPLGLSDWRWMFLAEGLPTVVLAFVALAYFKDDPHQVSWLNDDEKAFLVEDAAAQVGQPQSVASWPALFSSPRVWASVGLWFTLLTGAYGLIFWLPQVIKAAGGGDPLRVGILSALPWVGVGVGMAVNAWHSDKTGERYWHVAAPALLASAGFAGAAYVGAGGLALVLLIAGGVGLGAAQGAFWGVPSTFLTPATAAVGVTLINIAGSTGGLAGPNMIGTIRQATGSFALPVYAMAGLLVAGALLTWAIATLNRKAAA